VGERGKLNNLSILIGWSAPELRNWSSNTGPQTTTSWLSFLMVFLGSSKKILEAFIMILTLHVKKLHTTVVTKLHNDHEQGFGGPCCLHLQGEVKMVATWPFETLIQYITTRCHNPKDPRKLWYSTTSLQCHNPKGHDLNLHLWVWNPIFAHQFKVFRLVDTLSHVLKVGVHCQREDKGQQFASSSMRSGWH
jgi:hypothetical protein